MTSPHSSRPLTARALRCCFRLRRRSDPRGPRSLLQPHQPHRFLIIARRLWDRNVYSCIDGVHRLNRRFSDAGASVDKVHNPAVSSKCQKTPRGGRWRGRCSSAATQVAGAPLSKDFGYPGLVRRIPAPVVRAHLLIILIDLVLRRVWQWWLFALPPQLVLVCNLLLMVPRLEPCIGSLPQISRIVERNTSSVDETMYLLSVLQAQRLLPIEGPRVYPLA